MLSYQDWRGLEGGYGTLNFSMGLHTGVGVGLTWDYREGTKVLLINIEEVGRTVGHWSFQ